METLSDLRLAVLIDADNISYGNVKGMMEEIALYGTPTFKRIYGDWTMPTLAGWKNVLLENALSPIQQYSYTKGKNSTDSAMIIDAMDILYTGKVDGFCLVSSDSDFTKLATRLREAGMKVIGIGERKTPSPFIVACDKFIYIDIITSSKTKILPVETEIKKNVENTKNARKEETTEAGNIENLKRDVVNLISTAINDLADENGWAFLAEVGNLILKKHPNFDPRIFGHPKLTPLIKALGKFDIDIRETGQYHVKHIYIKNK